MKKLWLRFAIVLVSIILGCFLILILVFVFLAPHQAEKASQATFLSIASIMNALPLFLGIFASIGILAFFCKEVFDVVDRYLGSQRTWLENKTILIENMLKKDVILLPEGNVALTHPELDCYNRTSIPRAPRIQNVVDVSEKQEQLALPAHIPPMFDLKNDHNLQRPDAFYFGETTRGPLHVSLEDAYHIMDIAETGNGKSNRFRFLMAQAVKKGCETYFLSPVANGVKALKKNDDRVIEVWQPIFDLLADQPKTEFHDIEETLHRIEQEIYTRKAREKRFDFGWKNEPMYVFIDELPQIFKNCRTAVSNIATLATLGRNYCVFACIAAQGALVKTIGLNTDEIACFKTKIYGGGGRFSANNLLSSKVTEEQERALMSTRGLSLMLTEGINELTFVRAPRTTNEAIFDYLGCGPFVLEEWLRKDETRFTSPSPEYTAETPQYSYQSEGERAPAYALATPGQFSFSPIHSETSEKEVKQSGQRPLTEKEKSEVICAIFELEKDKKRLTLNAVKTETGLNWRVDDAIKEEAIKIKRQIV